MAPAEAAARSAALPGQLRPWLPWLGGLLDPAMRTLLGDWLLRLQPLLPGLHGLRGASIGQPAGLDGLGRRGSYERLLASEWLLAEELPDEFLRRAAQAEHLFLDRQFEQPRSQPRLLALFDAGPLQLGAPRLAHLAWWVLLARRAQAAGAAWSWGVLQGIGELHASAEPEALRQLLAARSLELLDSDGWEAWEVALGEQRVDELWLVGASPPPAVLDQLRVALGRQATVRVVGIEQVASFEQQLQVGIVTAGPVGARHGADAVLPLPEPRLAARLLRDPLAGMPGPTALPRAQVRFQGSISLQQAPWFAEDGQNLLLRLENGSAVLLSLPNSPNAQAGRVRRRSIAADTRALRLLRRNPAMIAQAAADRLELSGFTLGMPPRELRELPAPLPEQLQLPAGQWQPAWSDDRKSIWLLDGARRLHQWRLPLAAAPGTALQHQVLAQEVLAVLLHEGVLTWVTRVDGGFCWGDSSGSLQRTQTSRSGQLGWERFDIRQAFLARVPAVQRGGSVGSGWPVGHALALGDGQQHAWLLRAGGIRSDHQLRAGERLCGVVCGNHSQAAGLLVLAADQRSLRIEPGGLRIEAPGQGHIVQLSVDARGRQVAWLSSERELWVYSVGRAALVLWAQGEP